jgi:hypothetical protein
MRTSVNVPVFPLESVVTMPLGIPVLDIVDPVAVALDDVDVAPDAKRPAENVVDQELAAASYMYSDESAGRFAM